jgi:hypothetical protein
LSIVAVNGSAELTEAVRHFHRFLGDGVTVEAFAGCAQIATPTAVLFLLVEVGVEAQASDVFSRTLTARAGSPPLLATPTIFLTPRATGEQRLVLADAEMVATLSVPFAAGAYVQLATDMKAFVRRQARALAQRRALAEALARREFAAALALVPKLATLYADPARHLGRLKVEVLMASGDLAAALAAAQALVANAGSSLRAHELLLEAHERAGTAGDATRRALGAALALGPAHAFFLAARGHDQLATGALAEAAVDYLAALRQDAALIPARRGLIAVRLAEGRGRAADAELRPLGDDPGFVRFATVRAEALWRAGYGDVACRMLAGACDFFAEKNVSHVTLLLLTRLHHAAGDGARALDAMRRAKAAAPAGFELPPTLVRQLMNRVS